MRPVMKYIIYYRSRKYGNRDAIRIYGDHTQDQAVEMARGLYDWADPEILRVERTTINL